MPILKTDVVLIRAAFTSAIYSGVYKTNYKIGEKKVDPPFALMQLSAALIKNNLSVKIIDGEVNNYSLVETVDEVVKLNPLYVGITSTTPEMFGAITHLKEVKKKLPNVKTVFGGAHATHVPWEIIEAFPEIDFVVMYEGEKSLVAICTEQKEKLLEYTNNAKFLFEQNKIPNILFSDKILLGPTQSREELELNFAARSEEIISLENYKATDPSFGLMYSDSIETARGCPFGCTFCSSARSGIRVRSVENVLDELEQMFLLRSHSNRKLLVTFLDDTLTFNRERAAAIFEGILNRNLSIHFRAFTRANTIHTKAGRAEDLEFIKLMMRAGSTALSFGIESGSEQIHQGMNKGVKLEDYEEAYRLMELAGFKERRGSFIVGHPNETIYTIKESIQFAKKLKLNRVGVNIMMPYPGTSTYNKARLGEGIYFEKEAKNSSNYKRWGSSIVTTPTLSQEALVYWQKRFLTEVALSKPALKFTMQNVLNGNYSAYYHQPTISAVKSIGKLLHPIPNFKKPDHSNYNPNDFGLNHISKNDCIKALNLMYNTSFSTHKKQLIAVQQS